MVDTIEAAFIAAGYSIHTAAAAVVNAHAESGLNPLAVGDNGASIGLFQLHMYRGAGIGYTREQLINPERNAAVLVAKEARSLAKVEAEAAAGASIATLAGAFSRLVERPSDAVGAALARSALTVRLFPLGLSAPPTAAIAAHRTAPASSAAWWWWGAGGVVLLFGIGYGVYAYRRAYAPKT